MTEQSSNDQFHNESFLQGHNAEYVEQLQAQFTNDPNSVDESWQEFFRALGEEPSVARAEAAGPSWARADWPPVPNDDLTAALDGQWAEPVVVGDKIKAKAAAIGNNLRGTGQTSRPRFHSRVDVDPRLPHSRASGGGP